MSALSNTNTFFYLGSHGTTFTGLDEGKKMASKKSRREERPQTGNGIFAMTAQVWPRYRIYDSGFMRNEKDQIGNT